MTARLVAVGQKKPAYQTLYTQYAISDPDWSPLPSHDFEFGTPEVDPSDYRKQQIEEAIAWGEDL